MDLPLVGANRLAWSANIGIGTLSFALCAGNADVKNRSMHHELRDCGPYFCLLPIAG